LGPKIHAKNGCQFKRWKGSKCSKRRGETLQGSQRSVAASHELHKCEERLARSESGAARGQCLIYTLLEGYVRHLIVEGLELDGAFIEGDFAGFSVEPREGVLEPVDIVAIRVVLASVSTAGFLASLSGVHGEDGLSHQVLELKSLNEVSVPDQVAIGGLDVRELGPDLIDGLDTLFKSLSSAEDSGIALHNLLHAIAQFSSGDLSIGETSGIESGDSKLTSVGSEGLVRSIGLVGIGDVVSACATENDDIKKRVGTQAVGTVNGDTGSLTGSIKTGNDVVGVVALASDDLAVVVGGNTTHVVVHCRQDGDGLLRHVYASKDVRSFGDSRQSLLEHFCWQM
jgi:hypothetical protein